MPVEISGDSPHAIAYALLEQVAQAEQWVTSGFGEGNLRWNKSRKEILDTYRECLAAVHGPIADKYSRQY